MYFILISLVMWFVVTRLGWKLGRGAVVNFEPVGIIIFSFIWAAAIGLGMRYAIVAFAPNVLLRWIFGYALGGYVSDPTWGMGFEPGSFAWQKEQIVGGTCKLTYLIAIISSYYFIS